LGYLFWRCKCKTFFIYPTKKIEFFFAIMNERYFDPLPRSFFISLSFISASTGVSTSMLVFRISSFI